MEKMLEAGERKVENEVDAAAHSAENHAKNDIEKAAENVTENGAVHSAENEAEKAAENAADSGAVHNAENKAEKLADEIFHHGDKPSEQPNSDGGFHIPHPPSSWKQGDEKPDDNAASGNNGEGLKPQPPAEPFEEPKAEVPAVAVAEKEAAVEKEAAEAENYGKQSVQKVADLIKRRRRQETVSGWNPVAYTPREESDDEFDLATAKKPEPKQPSSDSDWNFKNGGPDYEGEITSCFKEDSILFRVVNRQEKTWAFYNDSLNYEMHIQFTFGKNSKIEPLENTTMYKKETGEFVAEVTVYPTETELFITGQTNGYTSSLRALPLSEEYHRERQKIADEKIRGEMEAIRRVAGDVTDSEQVLSLCLQHNLPFVDLEFPPQQPSLDTGATKVFKPLAWARPSMYLSKDMVDQVRVFRGDIKPADVDQGELGNCWLLCAIAAVSENPARIVNMFRHPKGDKALAKAERAVGAYRVTFNKNGIWRCMIVDDYFPISAGKPKYAKSNLDLAELWPSLLEKAFAKMHGSYANITSGDPLHALTDMTGFPTSRFDEALAEASKAGATEVFDHWVSYAKAGYQLVCSTPGGRADEALTKKYKSVGLVTGHAYALLDAKYFPEQNVRLVKIRNVWGQGAEWNGDWCDDDDHWTQFPAIAEACQFKKANDGTFWMTFEACLTYFNGGGVCFFHEPTFDYRIQSTFDHAIPSCVLQVDVTAPTWISFVLSQKDKRGRANPPPYQPMMLSIAKPSEDGSYKVVQNCSSNAFQANPDRWTFFQARDVSMIYRFEAGRYLVIPRSMVMDGQATEVPYVLGVLSNRHVGGGALEVSFKALPKSSRVFENFPRFNDEAEQANGITYQARRPTKPFPDTVTGDSITY